MQIKPPSHFPKLYFDTAQGLNVMFPELKKNTYAILQTKNTHKKRMCETIIQFSLVLNSIKVVFFNLFLYSIAEIILVQLV